MSHYEKRDMKPEGKYVVKGEEMKHKDTIQILNEGEKVNGTYGEQDVFKIKIPNGEERLFTLNSSTINILISAFGSDSKEWMNKDLKVWMFEDFKDGKLQWKTYLTEPEDNLEEVMAKAKKGVKSEFQDVNADLQDNKEEISTVESDL